MYVGSGAVACLPDLLPPRPARVAVVTQAGIPFAGAVCDVAGGPPGRAHRHRRRGGEQVADDDRARHEGVCRGWDDSRRRRHRSRWRHGHRRRWVRRCGVASRDRRRPRGDDASRHGRRRRRRQDRGQPARGQEPRRGVLATAVGCSAISTLSTRCRHGNGAAAMARWPSTTSLPVTTWTPWSSTNASHDASRSRRRSLPATNARAAIAPCSTTDTRSPMPLEIATSHALTHGEAVGIGLVYAAELAADLGRIDRDRVERAPMPSSAGRTACRRRSPPAWMTIDWSI